MVMIEENNIDNEIYPDTPNEELSDDWYLDPEHEIPHHAQLHHARMMRKQTYPPIAEQLDAFWKGGDEAEAMRQQVMAVKARFPKPAEE